MLRDGRLEFSKIKTFVLVMTSSVFHFVADTPGTKKNNFYDAEIKSHIFSCDVKSFKDGIFLKIFHF